MCDIRYGEISRNVNITRSTDELVAGYLEYQDSAVILYVSVAIKVLGKFKNLSGKLSFIFINKILSPLSAPSFHVKILRNRLLFKIRLIIFEVPTICFFSILSFSPENELPLIAHDKVYFNVQLDTMDTFFFYQAYR